MLNLPKIVVFLASTLIGAQAAQAYERHVYNNSKDPWYIKGAASKGAFNVSNCLPVYKNGVYYGCKVEPNGGEIAIHYIDTGHHFVQCKGKVTITNSKGESQDLSYGAVGFFQDRVKILTEPNSSAIEINHPAKGDIVIR